MWKEGQHWECRHSAPSYGTCVQHDPSHRWKGTPWVTESTCSGHTSELKELRAAHHRDRPHKKSCVISVTVRGLCWTNLDGARSTSGTHRAVTSPRPHQTSHWPAKGGPQGDSPHRERSHPTPYVHAFTCSTDAGFSQYNLTECSLLCSTRNVLHESPADFLELNF